MWDYSGQTGQNGAVTIDNMKSYNGKSVLILPPDLTIFSDASKKGWGAHCQGITTGG